MKVRQVLCNVVAVVPPAVASIYVALRLHVVIGAFLAPSASPSISEFYTARILDVLVLIVLTVGWFALTVWLEWRVSHAGSCRRALRASAQHLGITVLVFGLSDALFRLANPNLDAGGIATIIAGVSWLAGIGLVWYGYKRPPRGAPRG